MKYGDLREFIAQLEKMGELKRISVEVDPYLEMTEICDRVLRAGGPALLFEKPKGSTMPVLANLFGTPRRVALGMGEEDTGALREVGKLLAYLKEPEPPKGLKDAWDKLPVLKQVLNMAPRVLSSAPCQEVVWEADGADGERGGGTLELEGAHGRGGALVRERRAVEQRAVLRDNERLVCPFIGQRGALGHGGVPRELEADVEGEGGEQAAGEGERELVFALRAPLQQTGPLGDWQLALQEPLVVAPGVQQDEGLAAAVSRAYLSATSTARSFELLFHCRLRTSVSSSFCSSCCGPYRSNSPCRRQFFSHMMMRFLRQAGVPQLLLLSVLLVRHQEAAVGHPDERRADAGVQLLADRPHLAAVGVCLGEAFERGEVLVFGERLHADGRVPEEHVEVLVKGSLRWSRTSTRCGTR